MQKLPRLLWVIIVITGIVGLFVINSPRPAARSKMKHATTQCAQATPTPTVAATPVLQPLLKNTATQHEPLTSFETVVVKPNESFWQLARKHCGSHRFSETLAAYNGYTNVRKLRAGATIAIVCSNK